MRVRITQNGEYADFDSIPGKCGSVERRAGDTVNYPGWYAQALVESGHAQEVAEVVTVTEPELVPFADPTLSQFVPFEDDIGGGILDAETTRKIIDGIKRSKVDATDAARKLAEECGLDLQAIEGTGKDGRIVLADVRQAASHAGDG